MMARQRATAIVLLLRCCCTILFSPTASSSAWFSASSNSLDRRQPSSTPPPSNVRILILPGFGNDATDYLKPGSLVDSLVKRGWGNITPSEATVDGASSSSATTAVVNQQQQQQHPNIRVLPIQRTDWLKVFLRGCFDIKFWQNTADPTRPAFAWYLNHVANEIQQLTTSNSEHDNDDDGPASVILVGHSAGGWLGRAALGYYGTKNSNDSNASKLVDDDDDDEETNNKRSSSIHIDLTRISGMVTLGAPHLPPPPDIMDMTRGALRLTHENYPGAFFSNQLFYITVIGDAVRGMKQVRSNPMEPTSMTGFAYNSYEAVCGNGEATGDGVVPLCSAHLEGATQINLPGIYHSINAPDQWYGSDAVIDSWHTEMIRQIEQRQGTGIQVPSKASS